MSYSQEIYDAVRSKISGGDIGQAVRDVALNAFDISHSVSMVRDQFMAVAWEHQRPSVLFRPELSQDGDSWMAIYGDLPTGVVGCGETPAEAMADFDKAWHRAATVPDLVKIHDETVARLKQGQ